MHWYLEVLKKYAVLIGRARRKEYWLFVLFNVIIAVALGVIDGAAGLAITESGFGLLSGLYGLAVLIPSLAVTVRRLQDTGHSGWWLLIIVVPVIGVIWFLILMILDGQPGHNRFGPNPKKLEASTAQDMPAAAEVRTQAEGQALVAFCIKCGNKFPEVAAYCPKCGAPRTT